MVVVVAALGLLDFSGILRLRHVRDAEAGLALAALGGVLVFGVLGGLLFAVALSIASTSTARYARTTRFSARPTTSTATWTSNACRWRTSCLA